MHGSYFFNPSWLDGYESPYSLVHKFMWINSCGPQEVGLLFGLERSRLNSPKSLLQGDWVRSSPSVALPGVPAPDVLRGHFLDAICGPWAKLLGTKVLRYCPECLAHGFHSNLFQIRSLGSCPLHKNPLQTHCPGCGAGMARFELSSESLGRRCQCQHCKHTWAPQEGALQTWFSKAEPGKFAAAAEPVVRWLADVKLIPLPEDAEHEEEPLTYLSLEGCDVWSAFVRGLVGHCPFELDHTPAHVVRIVGEGPQSADRIGRKDYWVSLSRTFRSIRKHVERTYLASHRHWIWDYRVVDLTDQLSNPKFQRTQPPIVLAYRIWRSTIQRAQEDGAVLQGQSFFTRGFAEALDGEQGTHKLIAQCLLSYFFALCVETKHLVAAKERAVRDSHASGLARPARAQLAVLDWYRHFMQPYIGFSSGSLASLALLSSSGTAGHKRVALMAGRGAAQELSRSVTPTTQQHPDEYELLEYAVRAGELRREVFTSTGWPSLSRHARRRLRKRLNFPSPVGNV